MGSDIARGYLSGRVVTDTGVVDDGVVAFADARIAYAGPASGFDSSGWTLEDGFGADTTLLPGLVDLHCHGAYGGDFAAGDAAAARRAVDFLHRNGTTTLLASTVTAPRNDLLNAVSVLAGLAAEGLIAGIHAEGPFLSEIRCGAQDPRHLLDPDPAFARELIDAAGGALRSMTYAPELPGAEELVELLSALGVIPSLGHTNCDPATAAASLRQARRALESASGPSRRPTVTHLFNGMAPMHHRQPGPVPGCLRTAADGGAALELIADNTHLHPETVLSVFGLVGYGNICLVTDSMAAAGLTDGVYQLGPAEVEVAAGVASIRSTGSLAGGTATLLDVVRNTVAAGVRLESAVASASTVPASILGLGEETGALRHGLRADVVVATAALEVQAVLRQGRWL
jgi:N-acetylglucosamine-6-phosphate deacetylase